MIMLFLKAGFCNYSKTKTKAKAENFGREKATRTVVSLNLFLSTQKKQANEMDLCLGTRPHSSVFNHDQRVSNLNWATPIFNYPTQTTKYW